MKNDKPLDLNDVLVNANVADRLSEDYLAYVGSMVQTNYEKDKNSRSKWENIINKALKLSSLEYEKKDFPWPGASNIKYPLISNAVIQFAARTVPEIVRGKKVVEVAVVGQPTEKKEQRARRVASHMSYQLLIESSEWEESVDKLVTMIANVGIAHKKTYYDPIRQRNVSELLTHEEFVVHYNIPCLEEARRATHVLHYHTNKILAHVRAGLFVECDIEELHSSGMEADNELFKDDEENYHELLEQHCYLDLDDDGYEEPYVVTVHRDSGKVLRIVGRFDPEGIERNKDDEIIHIEPVQYFTDFHFLPSMDGSYYSLGFGTLLYSLNETVNTTYNQLLDSGTLANLQGGFVGKGLRIKGGISRHRPGEWKQLDSALGEDIARNVVPLQYKEPSNVLFQLLGTTVEAVEKFSSITDVMSGQQTAQNVPATTILSLIEQGLKVFSSIQKRLHRSLKKEFEKLYRLNRVFLDPEVYFRTVDEEGVALQSDYEDDSLDIRPVSDPRMASDAQRLARSQALLQLLSLPGTKLDRNQVLYRYLKDLETPDVEKLFMQNEPPSPDAMKAQMEQQKQQGDFIARGKELEIRNDELLSKIQLEREKIEIQREKAKAEIAEIQARAIDALARAEAAEVGQQLEQYKIQLEALKAQADLEKDLNSETYNRNIDGVQNVNSQFAEASGTAGPSDSGSIDNRILDEEPSNTEPS